MPVSSRFEQNGALELTLEFEKKYNRYHLISMKATLLIEGEFDRKCSIPERYGLDVNHAVYLRRGGEIG